jgi:hypothetical protein
MRSKMAANRVAWLAGGLLAGLAIAWMWPHEPTYANTADRDSQFMMITVPVGNAGVGILDPLDAVFILDFLTGQLKGACLNRQTGAFASFYYRDLAKDFQVAGDADPHYAMASGYAQMPASGGLTMASGALYVAELTSGKLAAYAFPWKEQGIGAPIELTPLAVFPWKQPSPKGK